MQEQNQDPSAYPGQYASPAGMGASPQYTGYSTSGNDPLNTAKWAGLVQIILGSLVMALGLCCLGPVLLVWDTMMMEPEFQQAMAQVPDPALAKIVIGVMVFLMLGVGLMIILFGVFMRRGSKVAALCSVVVMSLVTLYFVINLVGMMIAATMSQGVLPGLFAGVMLLFVSIGGLVMSIAGLRSVYQWHREWTQWQEAYAAYQSQQQPPQQQY